MNEKVTRFFVSCHEHEQKHDKLTRNERENRHNKLVSLLY